MGISAPSRASRRPFARLLRWFAVMVAILLVIRVAFVEQFVVTTGSMAPLILGVHRQRDCPKCGFPVVVGAPHDGSAPDHYSGVKCPNCGSGDLGLENLPDQPGQRLWVDKTAYEWRAPRRWELAVFRGADDRGTLYVKRVVGLPGETVQIKDGEVYINGAYCPILLPIPAAVGLPCHQMRPALQGQWQLEGTANQEPAGLSLIADPLTPSRAVFHVSEGDRLTDYWVYNGAKVNRIEKCDDLVMAFTITASAGARCRLLRNDQLAESQAIEIRGAQHSILDYFLRRPPAMAIPNSRFGIDVKVGTATPIVARLARQTSWASVNDGTQAGLITVADRGSSKERRPAITFEILSGSAILSDIFISQAPRYQSAGRHGIATPCRLGPHEYFMLGDNSADSDDSRFWPEPGVPASRLIGRPMFMKR